MHLGRMDYLASNHLEWCFAIGLEQHQSKGYLLRHVAPKPVNQFGSALMGLHRSDQNSTEGHLFGTDFGLLLSHKKDMAGLLGQCLM